MEVQARVEWLRQTTVFGELPDEVLEAIAAQIQERSVSENRRLVLEDTPPDALYILKSGRLEHYRTRPNSVAQASSLLPGAVLYLRELLLEEPAEQTLITLSDCELWLIPRTEFAALAARYPEIGRSFSRQLASQLSQVSSRLAFEQERQTVLLPYRISRVRRGVVGSSRYAVRLRQDIRKAWGFGAPSRAVARRPVLIFGEPGLGKDNIAALIHFGGGDRKEPLIKLNCDTLQPSGADLFGRAGGKVGLLDWLGSGTLLLNNIQDLPKELEPQICRLLESGEYFPAGAAGTPHHSDARIIMTSERTLPELDRRVGYAIKVPPLRVRKADLEAQVNYYISLYCTSRGLPKPTIAPEALRQLQGYDFPGNLSELESLVARAIIQSSGATVLTEEVFWSASTKARRFRFNLLNGYPQLRQFLRSPWYPDRINFGFTLAVFALVVGVLLWGPQSRDRNFALNLFWAWWWMLILLGFPFVGRIWCAFCPFMIYGELAQKLSLWLFPGSLRTWSRPQAERWGGWFLFGLFALILLWEELWDLENTAYLSGCLLLLITAGAVIFSVLFERRFWCRYLCPIGGMNGLFAKLSMIELRAQQGICSASCSTYQCYKGGPEKGEGMATGGCPVYSHPAQLQDNRNCVLCMTCLKACPHRSVELNLRPPGIELWTSHEATAHEVCLLFLLFGAVFLHRLPEMGWTLEPWLGQFGLISGWSTGLENAWVHLGLSVGALLVPGAIALLAHRLIRWSQPKLKSFVELAYGYLPLVLLANLAHYFRLGLTEAGQILPVTLATFGYSGVGMPVAIAHPAVIAFLQGVALLLGVGLSVALTQKIARQSFWTLLPQHLATGVIAFLLWQVIVGW